MQVRQSCKAFSARSVAASRVLPTPRPPLVRLETPAVSVVSEETAAAPPSTALLTEEETELINDDCSTIAYLDQIVIRMQIAGGGELFSKYYSSKGVRLPPSLMQIEGRG